MRWLRINIAGLMALVLLAAIGLAVLRNLPGKWAHFALCLALGLNFAAMVIALGSESRVRISALGYTVFGWGYLVLVSIFPWFDAFVRNNVITAQTIRWFFQSPQPVEPSYEIVAHSLFGISAGLAGALIGWNLIRQRSGSIPSTATSLNFRKSRTTTHAEAERS